MIKRTSLILSLLFTILFANQNNFVFSINMNGNNKFEDSLLKNKIRLKERGFLSKSEFNKKLQLDEITLENFYRTHGYNDIEIISKFKVFQGTDIIIDFLIIEGEQYKVKKINFDGLRIFKLYNVLKLIDIKTGDVYNPAKIRRNLKKLVNKYFRNGKNISIVEDINFESNFADINILVSEGSTFSIRNINIFGLVDVESKYIHRELLISEGMLYDVNLITKSREQIFESGLFSSVEIEPHIINDNHN